MLELLNDIQLNNKVNYLLSSGMRDECKWKLTIYLFLFVDLYNYWYYNYSYDENIKKYYLCDK